MWKYLAATTLFWFLSSQLQAQEDALVGGGQSFQPAEQSQLVSEIGDNSTIQLDSVSGVIQSLEMRPGAAISQPYNGRFSSNTAEAAKNFLDQHGVTFGGVGSSFEEIKNSSATVNGRGTRQASAVLNVQRFAQRKHGLPVAGAQVVLRLDDAAEIVSVNGRTSTVEQPPAPVLVDASTASQLAIEQVARQWPGHSNAAFVGSVPRMMIVNPQLFGYPRDEEFTTWYVEVRTKAGASVRQHVYIDVQSGGVVLSYDALVEIRDRLVYDSGNDDSVVLPGSAPVRVEGDPEVSDSIVNDAYRYAGDFHNFMLSRFNFDSYDGAGAPLVSVVRYCDPLRVACPLFDASWDGAFARFGEDYAVDDVVAHEFVHAFTEQTSNLIYLNESGAINESMSDIFGELIDLEYFSGIAGDDDPSVRWIVGEDLPNNNIRDMADPASNIPPGPDRIQSPNYVCAPFDNGGVHTNSAVGNKAATLLVDGGVFNGETIQGIGVAKTAALYFDVQNRLVPTSTYQNLGNQLSASCHSLIGGSTGISANDCQQVDKTILATEMLQSNVCVSGQQPLLCDTGEPSFAFSEGFEDDNLNSIWDQVVISAPPGITPDWLRTTVNPASGVHQVEGSVQHSIDHYLANTTPVQVPIDGQFVFEHSTYLEDGYDGGVVEYTTDGGQTWFDMGPLFTDNAYDREFFVDAGHAGTGRDTFSGIGAMHRRTIADLSSLAGSDIQFRFRLLTNQFGVSVQGWRVDDVGLYTCASGGGGNPVANSDSMTLLPGATQTTLDGGSLSVLSNDTDPDPGDTLIASLKTFPRDGSISLNADGTFVFAHDGSAAPSDSFTYTVSDANGGPTSDAVVTITITEPELNSPVNPALASTTETFSWTGNGLQVHSWWLQLGPTQGSSSYYNASTGTATSQLVDQLPGDGSSVYLRLWFRMSANGSWMFRDYQFTAASLGDPEITSPSAALPLPAASVPFNWSDNGSGVQDWWVYVGTSANEVAYFNSGLLAHSTTSINVDGLPLDGSTVLVRLWYRYPSSNEWISVTEEFTAHTASGVAMTDPDPALALTSSDQIFTWAANDASVDQWWFYAGTSVGASDLANSEVVIPASQLSYEVTNIPLNGQAIHIRLWFRSLGGSWQFVDSEYQTDSMS